MFGSLTQATDTANIRLVFAAVKERILQNALKDLGSKVERGTDKKRPENLKTH